MRLINGLSSVRFISSIVCAGALVLSAASAGAQSATNSKVLRYDSKGRVISADTYKNKSKERLKAGPKESSNAFGDGPDTPFNGDFDGGDMMEWDASPDWDTSIGEGPGTIAPAKPPYEPGEVLVVDPGDGFEGRAVAMGFRILESVPMKSLGIHMLRLAAPKPMSAPDAIKLLSIEFPETIFDTNTRFTASAGPAQKHARTARAMAGWQKISPTCGKDIKLGMIDTGVDRNHPALKGQNIAHRAFTSHGRKPGDKKHGTAIANMLAGKAEWGGLLPGARLYSANMFEINEEGRMVGNASSLVKAMEWMAWLKVDAVNLSIAGDDNKLVRRAMDIADKAGLLLVASVGSWGNSSRRAFPASYAEVVAVTALKSNRLVYKYANSGPHVDFAAPGTGIWSATPGEGGALHYGTSFATPYITATAAILKQAGRAPSVGKFRTLLSRAVKDLGKPGRDDVFGYGALNVRPACKS